MAFCGLVPSEYSSGNRTQRGHLTKSGNVEVRRQLIESAWAYQHAPKVTAHIAKRHEGIDPETVARAWKPSSACAAGRQLAVRKESRNVVVAAIARELSGFVSAEMTS